MDKEAEHTRDQKTLERMTGNIRQLRQQVYAKHAAKLQLDLLERIARRLDSFACEECTAHLAELDRHVAMLASRLGALDKAEQKQHDRLVATVKGHLQKAHGLIPEGTYTGIGMTLGMSAGLALGLLFDTYITLGLPIGLSIGLAVGAGLDADARKKEKVI